MKSWLKYVCSKCERAVSDAGDFKLWRHSDGSLMCEDGEAVKENKPNVNRGGNHERRNKKNG